LAITVAILLIVSNVLAFCVSRLSSGSRLLCTRVFQRLEVTLGEKPLVLDLLSIMGFLKKPVSPWIMKSQQQVENTANLFLVADYKV
jgi:hypothetical protein